MTHSTRELYNCSPLWFIFIPYLLAIYFKRHMANRNMKRLVKLSWHCPCDYSVELNQYNASKKARAFNEKLIREVW